jgi:peptidase E
MEGRAVPDNPRQIIALGGGGFSMEPKNLTLDRYVLVQARTPEPAIAFVPTASGDAESYIVHFYTAFSQLPCRPSHLPLFRRTPDLRAYLLTQDVIYVGGGNTKSMLAVWRDWELPALLREAWASGIILAGISAGAICWFEQGGD